MISNLKILIFILLLSVLPASYAEDLPQNLALPTSNTQIAFELDQIKADGENVMANLSSLINGKKYFIHNFFIKRGIGSYHESPNFKESPVALDPTGNFVFFGNLNGCGYENDGIILYRSDLKGTNVEPLFGTCRILTFSTFFYYDNSLNLLIHETDSGSNDRSFWIYSITQKKIILHAEGGLEPKGNSTFNYCPPDTSDDQGLVVLPCKIIQTTSLFKKRTSFPILPPSYHHAKTKRDHVEFDVSGCINSDNNNRAVNCMVEHIPLSGTKLEILEESKDKKTYMVYYKERSGFVKKEDLTEFQF